MRFLRRIFRLSKKSSDLPRNARRSMHFTQMRQRKEEVQRASTLRPSKRKRTKSLGNRFFKKAKRITIITTAILVVAIITYLLFLSESFKIKTISYFENEISAKSPPFTEIFDKFRGTHLIFVPSTKLRREVLEVYPAKVANIRIEKKLPSKLIIKYETFPEALNLIMRLDDLERKFIINSEGIIVKQDAENSELPYLRTTHLTDFPKLQTEIFEKDLIEKIQRASTLFRDKFGMKVPEIVYKHAAREIHLRTERNFMIWIDLTQGIDRQLFKLKRALSKIDIYNENLEYIDLRISGHSGDKVLFKKR